MNEILYWNISFIVAFGCTIVWLVAPITGFFWSWIWSWIDDAKMGKNPVVNSSIFTSEVKWKRVDKVWRYQGYALGWEVAVTDQESRTKEGETVQIYIGVLPLIWVLAIGVYFYQVSVWFLLAAAILFLARFGRRNQKLFNTHIKDKDAHGVKDD